MSKRERTQEWENPTHYLAIDNLRRKDREKQRERELYDFRRFHAITWPQGVDPDIIRAVIPKGMTAQGTVRRLMALFAAKQIGKDAFLVLAQQQSPTSNARDIGLDLAQFCNCPNCDGSHWLPPARILQTINERLENDNARDPRTERSED